MKTQNINSYQLQIVVFMFPIQWAAKLTISYQDTRLNPDAMKLI